MQIPKERQVLITISVTVAAALAVYLFLYSPLIVKLSKAHRQCKAIEADLLKTRQALASVGISGIKKILPAENDISSCIDEITGMGRLKSINFISITPKQIELGGSGEYKILPLELQIKGAYSQIGSFLGALDELEKGLVVIKNFKITTDPAEPSKLRAGLLLYIYLEA